MRFKQKGFRRGVWSGATGWQKVGLLLVALAVFNLGVAVGDGRLRLQRPVEVSNNLPSKLDYSSVNRVYQSLRENYDGKLTEKDLVEGLKHGLAEATNDPYTEYFTAKEAEQFEERLNNSFSGIGAELGKDKDDNLIVVAPIAGMPAAKAGLRPQDIITNINGESTVNLAIDEAVSKIRGKAGSKVRLQIVRNRSEQLSFTITRQNIQVPSVKTKMLKNNVGYIQIVSFSDDTARLMEQAVSQMVKSKVKGIVLDLRGNPGGLLEAGVEVASQWLPAGAKVLDEKRGPVVVEAKTATGGNELQGIPTVVLIDEGSASASEIVAGALHDHEAAYLIGAKTYGKGVVQQLVSFRDGSQLKVTVASWYRPNGQNINKKGITPNQTVKMSDADIKAKRDPQLQAAEDYLSK